MLTFCFCNVLQGTFLSIVKTLSTLIYFENSCLLTRFCWALVCYQLNVLPIKDYCRPIFFSPHSLDTTIHAFYAHSHTVIDLLAKTCICIQLNSQVEIEFIMTTVAAAGLGAINQNQHAIECSPGFAAIDENDNVVLG